MALIISNKFKYIFFHLPKNAGTTVSNKLFEIETFSILKKATIHILKIIKNKKKAYNFFFCKKNFKFILFNSHSSVSEIEKIIDNDIFNNYFKFVIIRNPFDRFVSRYLYFNKIDKNFKYKNFEKFIDWDIQHKKVLHQKSFITKKDGEIGVDKIIKFEDLSNDFGDTIKILGIKFTDSNLKKLNFTNNLGYRKYYDNNTRYKVEKFCLEDLEYFNYKF